MRQGRLRGARSFALLAAAGLGVQTAAIVGTSAIALLTLPCQWAPLSRVYQGVCGVEAWPSRYFPWIATGVMVALVVAWTASLVWEALRQIRGARDLVRHLARGRVPTSARLQEAARRAGVDNVVEVEHPKPHVFCHGLARPQLVVSTGALEVLGEDELAAVIAHEAVHVRQRDALRITVLRAIAAAAFAVPVLRDLADHTALNLELDADHRAVETVGMRPTARALHALLSAPRPLSQPAALAGFDLDLARVRHLRAGTVPVVQLQRRRVAFTVATSAALLLVAVVSLAAWRGAASVTDIDRLDEALKTSQPAPAATP